MSDQVLDTLHVLENRLTLKLQMMRREILSIAKDVEAAVQKFSKFKSFSEVQRPEKRKRVRCEQMRLFGRSVQVRNRSSINTLSCCDVPSKENGDEARKPTMKSTNGNSDVIVPPQVSTSKRRSSFAVVAENFSTLAGQQTSSLDADNAEFTLSKLQNRSTIVRGSRRPRIAAEDCGADDSSHAAVEEDSLTKVGVPRIGSGRARLTPLSGSVRTDSSINQAMHPRDPSPLLALLRRRALARDLDQKRRCRCAGGQRGGAYALLTEAVMAAASSVLGIRRADAALGRPGSRVIHPYSPFATGFQGFSGLLLLYTLATAPLQVSFWDFADPCSTSPTQSFDLFVDAFFLFEIAANFFIGIEENGLYIDSLPIIAWSYVTTINLFWFDLLTSIPITWIEWVLLEGCVIGQGVELSPNLAFIRAVKPMRILKMTRLLKLFKLVREFSEKCRMRPAHRKVLNLLTTLTGAMHIFTCFFWRVKKESQTDEELADFLSSHNIGSSISEVYVSCLYFVCTVFTTVGFGDISATSFNERLFCIAMMCTAACLFGIILSELQQIFAVSNARSRELDDHMESVISVLKENSVPPDVEMKLRGWMRFQFSGTKSDEQSRTMIRLLPVSLREVLAGTFAYNGIFSKVSLLERIPDDDEGGCLRCKLVAELMAESSSCFYPAKTKVACLLDKADRLMIVCSGTVGVMLPGESSPIHMLCAKETFGETAVLGDHRWGGLWGVQADFVALSDCKIVSIRVDQILRLLRDVSTFAPVQRIFQHLNALRDNVPVGRSDTESNQERRSTFRWIRTARRLLSLTRLDDCQDDADAMLTRLRASRIHLPVSHPPRSFSKRSHLFTATGSSASGAAAGGFLDVQVSSTLVWKEGDCEDIGEGGARGALRSAARKSSG